MPSMRINSKLQITEKIRPLWKNLNPPIWKGQIALKTRLIQLESIESQDKVNIRIKIQIKMKEQKILLT